MSEKFPTRMIPRAGSIRHFDREPTPGSDITYQWQGETYTIDELAARNHTTSLVVIHRGVLVHEQYLQGARETTHLTSFSMAKSLVGLLTGIAVGEGAIKSISDPVTQYVPELKGTGYDGATVKDLLQMSSGVKWNEKYTSRTSDIARFSGASIIMNLMPANQFMKTLPRLHKPGTVFNYSSGETQVLGWVVSAATGQSLSDYLQEKLWSKLGMEHDAYWLLDRNNGDEFSSIGINAAARDYARIGQLMLQDGVWDGNRLLPEGWVKASTRPDGDHVDYGNVRDAQPDFGYGYQWWIYEDGSYDAEGVFGQFIWVNPREQIVIVKTSVWPGATVHDLKQELLTGFRAISKYFSDADKESR
ncbi:MAG: serine hydrolase [Proteobacteria bacterium]|nr:serine hydrolase [Pseudomonadota bacterium]